MDREADSYLLLHQLLTAGGRFVIRSKADRRLATDWPDTGWLRPRLKLAENLFVREVPISSRRRMPSEGARRAHPQRERRLAKLAFSVAHVSLQRPEKVNEQLCPLMSLLVNVVWVHEIDAPADCEPVEWFLLTGEPVETLEQIAFVVDTYRARWRIEEYFKALKTGCAFERRQLETRRALLNAMAVFIPIAWRLLRLKTLAIESPSRPATEALSDLQLSLLRAHPQLRGKLGPDPSVADAMLAIAQLGGHIKNNGAPGWIVLGRGLEDLLKLEVGARLMQGLNGIVAEPICDQS
jgi:hypothetical protein